MMPEVAVATAMTTATRALSFSISSILDHREASSTPPAAGAAVTEAAVAVNSDGEENRTDDEEDDDKEVDISTVH